MGPHLEIPCPGVSTWTETGMSNYLIVSREDGQGSLYLKHPVGTTFLTGLPHG